MDEEKSDFWAKTWEWLNKPVLLVEMPALERKLEEVKDVVRVDNSGDIPKVTIDDEKLLDLGKQAFSAIGKAKKIMRGK